MPRQKGRGMESFHFRVSVRARMCVRVREREREMKNEKQRETGKRIEGERKIRNGKE